MEYFLTKIILFLKDKANRDAVVKIISIIAVIGGFMYLPDACRSCTDSLPSSSYSTDSEIDAYTTSKRIIEKILKAPSTAKFQSYDKSLVSFSGNTYTVIGYVDSQNSFGAMLRSHYKVVLIGSAYSWEIESVIFDGERIR